MKIILAPNYQGYLNYIREMRIPKRETRFPQYKEEVMGLVLAKEDIMYAPNWDLNPIYTFQFMNFLASRIRKREE